MAVGDS